MRLSSFDGRADKALLESRMMMIFCRDITPMMGISALCASFGGTNYAGCRAFRRERLLDQISFDSRADFFSYRFRDVIEPTLPGCEPNGCSALSAFRADGDYTHFWRFSLMPPIRCKAIFIGV